MHVFAIDLGTTNLKVVLYDDELRTLGLAAAPMRYHRFGPRVEFDPDEVFELVMALIHECALKAGRIQGGTAHIVVTGQAESLILVDAEGAPVAPGISWMDERSGEESREIAERFDPQLAFATTGQPAAVPTWPATKLRWLSKHQPETLAATRRALMIKDYLLLRLTGRAVGEETTRGFTYLYDVRGRTYWAEMLDFCGTKLDAMPELVPAGSDVGRVLPEVARRLPPGQYTVNAGALDHMCAMVGTDSYRPGQVSASAGTVLSLSMVASDWEFDPAVQISFHAGLRPNDTVLFTCADSGGVCLSWFRENIATDIDYDTLERILLSRTHEEAPLFLPYLTGVNPPDYFTHARGAFLELQLRHDRFDLAFAVMDGLAHLLRRNLEYLAIHGQAAQTVVSAGGGTASPFWNQLNADVCALEFRAPREPEAACRGAAVLALVAANVLESIDSTAHLPRDPDRTFLPRSAPHLADRRRAFDSAVHQLFASAHTP